MIRFLIRSALLVSALFSMGCATDRPKDASQNHVSTIPWNRPEKWENQSGIGGMLGTQ